MATVRASSSAVRIKGDNEKVIYLPKGESVKLGCPFASDPEDNTPDSDWDIEWKQVKPGPYSQDNRLLGYHDHRVFSGGPPDLQQRVGFAYDDPTQYDASMQLRDVQIADSATYECKVKKTTEASHRVTITVQDRPAVPQCLIIGTMALGHDITLRCVASTGTPPLSYRWAMTRGHRFRDWKPSIGSLPGDIHIRNLCDDDVGTYQCSVGNNVGVAYCSVDISFGGLDSGWLIGGSLLIALLTAALIAGGVVWCCCCCCGKGYGCGSCKSCYCGEEYCWDCCCSRGQSQQQEIEQSKSNEICVDADAPMSRPCSQAVSRAGSLHSLFGYQTRNVQYVPARKYSPPIVQVKMSDSDMDCGLPLDCTPPDSEQGEVAGQFYPMKGRDPCPTVNSSPGYVRGEGRKIPNQQRFSTLPQDSGRPLKGTVVMMRSASKEGLLI
ncbi:hypothetical protein lerEdw1_002899 [Lerista edwardsae]|nr:hypothetical protein lerEdw1_002899 [Lerista edwardsae]